MRTTLKISSCFILTLLLFTFSCSSDDNSGGAIVFNVENLVTNFDENPTTGASIATIQATSPSTLSFNITSQTPMGALSISATTGELSVANPDLFDFETNPIINATVSVIDSDNMDIANVTINLNDLDSIADLLSTSQTSYAAAANGDWVIITEVEYNSLAGNLNEVTKVATSDADYNSSETTLNGGVNPFTIANNNDETMPNNSYCFAFKYNTTNDGSAGTKVKQSSASVNSGYTNLGGVLPTHDSGDNYFVLKGSNSPTTNVGYLAIYYVNGIRFKDIATSNSYYSEPGDVTALTSPQNNATWLFQGLSTTQQQW